MYMLTGIKVLYKYMKAFMLLDEPTFLDVLMLFLDALASLVSILLSHTVIVSSFFYWKHTNQHPVGFDLSTRNMVAAPVF